MYVTKKDSTITAYGMTITLFGRPADRHVEIGRDTQGGRCSMRGCRERATVYLVRTVTVDVNARHRRRAQDSSGLLPIPPVALGFDFRKLWACPFHFPEMVDHAYLMPGHGERPFKLQRRPHHERTVCVQGRYASYA